ncbi:RHS repeat-associated core domain-containing protein [Variovorax paradoxus]|uniref:RHS repeat-associated core domain-containing protein n=1 Tax=Variovorax paradoxus TaxID=34073 RepID=UPI003D65B9E4
MQVLFGWVTRSAGSWAAVASFVLLLLASLSAQALPHVRGYTVSYWGYMEGGGGGSGRIYPGPGPDAACASDEAKAVAYWKSRFFNTTIGVPVMHNGSCVIEQPTESGPHLWGGIDMLASTNCPENSEYSNGTCQCKFSFQENGAGTGCIAATPQPASSNMCMFSFGKPIVPATGEEVTTEIDIELSGPDPLTFARTYRSGWSGSAARSSSPLGLSWAHNHDMALKASPAADPVSTDISLAGGEVRSFSRDAGSGKWVAAGSADTLTHTAGGDWILRRASDDSSFHFDGSGKLQVVAQRNGRAAIYTYDGEGRLATVSNAFGRTLSFTYLGGKLASAFVLGGQVVRYTYDSAGRLSTAVQTDGKFKTYLYENPAFPLALTGIVDEAGQRYATMAYDNIGRAVETQLAGGAYKYGVKYGGSLSQDTTYATVTDPLGTSRDYTYKTVKGQLGLARNSAISADSGQQISYQVQDASGLITREADFSGLETTTKWDSTRRLPTSVTTAGSIQRRTVSTIWHPLFALPVLVTEEGRKTAFEYDAAGNLLSQTVTDTAGTPGSARTTRWTYTSQGLVETETSPNGAVTTFSYDAFGNLSRVSNALGHVTRHTYDGAHRLSSTTAPNGAVTTYTYDSRDRLLTRTVDAQTTSFTYKPYGAVETVTFPAGLSLTYVYDAAHRVTGWNNNRGESGVFALDGMGNRISEQVRDAAGHLAWNVVRAVNNLNRVASQTEGADLTKTFGYDSNGDAKSTTNGLNQMTYFTRDQLGRPDYFSNAGGSSTLRYDALDAVIEAKDAISVVTSFTRDVDGNATSESSADTGSASTQYDALGLPKQITDALGQATTISRDLLGRPTSLLFADGKSTTLRYDRSAHSVGYLSEIVDRSGATEYTRDALGRVVLKRQVLANGSAQLVSYSYNPNGTLAAIGYPNGGGLLTYGYDGTGRLTELTLNGKPLVTGLSWNPLGQATAWTWSFGASPLAASRTYDTAGRLTQTDFASYVYDAAGRIKGLSQRVYRPGTDPEQAGFVAGDVTWSIGHDAAGRVTSFNMPGNTSTFAYDPNGNRTESTRNSGGVETKRVYSRSGLHSNRFQYFSQTINNGSSTSVAYAYDGNGALTGNGLRTFAYDAEGRLSSVTTGTADVSPTTRYAHNALGQRVFKTEPLYPPTEGEGDSPGFMRSLSAEFFAKMWDPSFVEAEQLGYAYVYDEQGTLISESGSGGARSAGQAQYIYLPTPSGPMPIAAVIDGMTYAVHSDHLNTPRLLTNDSNQPVWQWTYSAFGEDPPTLARYRFAVLDKAPNPGTTGMSELRFNLRYPGQYADEESGLFYNFFRSYDARTGRYTQADPIGLDGGWNRFGYVDGNPLSFADPDGLETVYQVGGVTFYANPGPPDPTYIGGKVEHGKQQGHGWHVHTRIGGVEGPRILTATGQIYPGDEKLCTGDFKKAIDSLRTGEMKYLHRAGVQVFLDKKIGNRLLNARVKLQGIRAAGFRPQIIKGLE